MRLPIALALVFVVSVLLAGGVNGSLAPVTVRAEAGSACGYTPGWSVLSHPPVDDSWMRPRNPRGTEYLLNVAPSMAQKGKIVAGGFTNPHVSQDCGKTWQELLVTLVRPVQRTSAAWIAIDGHDDYYITNDRGPLFVSRDQGATWDVVQAAWSPGSTPTHFYANVTATSPLNGGVIYAESFQVRDTRNPPPVGLWRSYDRGRSWEPVEITAQRPSPLELVHNQRSITAVDPYDATLLYGVTTDGQIIVSRDAAASWEVSSMGNGCGLLPSEVWRTVKLSATGDRLWLLTNSGRLLVRRASDGACTGVNPPSVTMRVSVIAPDPFDSATVYTVTSESEDRQLWVYHDPTTEATP